MFKPVLLKFSKFKFQPCKNPANDRQYINEAYYAQGDVDYENKSIGQFNLSHA
jgi:hypothetical protein